MNDFLKDLQDYISTAFNANKAFTKVTVNRAYSKSTQIKSPQISIYVLGDDDLMSASTFDAEHATVYPVQFYCYWKDGIKYNNKAVGSQLGCEILGEELSKLFEDKDKVMADNQNILLIEKIGGKPFGMPTLDGSANYQSVPRFVFTVKKPYTANN